MPLAPPEVLVGASPSQPLEFLKMLKVTAKDEVDALMFLPELAMKYLPTNYSLETDDNCRTFYWNRHSKDASWFHPYQAILETAVNCYRLAQNDPHKVIHAFNLAIKSQQVSQKRWKRENSSRSFYRQDTLQQRIDDPSRETIDASKLLEAAFYEIWATFVLKNLKDKETERAGFEPDRPTLPEDHVLAKVISYPLPAPWVSKLVSGNIKFINTLDHTETQLHPLHAFHKELEDAAWESAALSKILEKEISKGDERMLRLLCVREIWRATCTAPFPQVLPLTPQPTQLQVERFLEISTTKPVLSMAAQEAIELEELPQSPRDAVRKVESEVDITPEKSERRMESAIRLESIEFLANHFGCNLAMAFRALSAGLPVSTKATFLGYFEKYSVAAPPYSPSTMFDAIDVYKRGHLTREDLYIADDKTIATSQRILQSVTDSLLDLVVRQVLKVNAVTTLRQRPSTAETSRRMS